MSADRRLPHRIVPEEEPGLDVVDRSRIGAAALLEGGFLHASSVQQSREAKISLDAARLHIKFVLLVALLRELFLGGPRPRPYGRILDRGFVQERSGAGAGPALDQVQVLARALKIRFRTEVRHVDDERVSFPVAARVAVPLADAGRQVRAPVHDNVALPALSLAHVVEHRDAAGSLHDAPEAADPAAKF